MLTPTVDGILVALKSTVNMNVNFHCLQDSGSPGRYGYRVNKEADPPERENVRSGGRRFLTAWWTRM